MLPREGYLNVIPWSIQVVWHSAEMLSFVKWFTILLLIFRKPGNLSSARESYKVQLKNQNFSGTSP
jgi:hypothetical protein